MFIAFMLKASAYSCLQLGADPVWFVLLSGVVSSPGVRLYSLFSVHFHGHVRSKFAATTPASCTRRKEPRRFCSLCEFHPEGDRQLGPCVHHRGGGQHSRCRSRHAALKPWRRKVVAANDTSRHRRAPRLCRPRLLTRACSGVGGSARRTASVRTASNRLTESRTTDKRWILMNELQRRPGGPRPLQRTRSSRRRATPTSSRAAIGSPGRSRARARHDLLALRGHIIDIYDGCVDEDIRIVDVRREQVAAHAADWEFAVPEGHHVNARASSGARALLDRRVAPWYETATKPAATAAQTRRKSQRREIDANHRRPTAFSWSSMPSS